MASSPAYACLQALLRRTALPQLDWTGPTQTALWPLCPWTKDMRVWLPHLVATTRPEGARSHTERLPHRIRTWTKPSLLSGEGGLDTACMQLSLSACDGNQL